MSNRKNYYFRREILIHKAERKLPKDVPSEFVEVDRPAFGGVPDSFYRLLKCAFKVNRCNQTAFAIPGQRCQIFSLRLRMKSKRLTCHAAVYVLFAEPLPKGSSSLCRTAPHPGGARPLAARRRQRPDRRSYPGWTAGSRLAPPVRSRAMLVPSVAGHGLLASYSKLYSHLQTGLCGAGSSTWPDGSETRHHTGASHLQ